MPDDKDSTARPGDEIKPSSYRKLPVEIKAIRWSGHNLRQVIAFTGLHPSADKWEWDEYEEVVRTKGLKIFTLEGHHMATVGDYIIKGVHGEFYPCKPDIFWKTYERATAPLPESGTPSDATARAEAVIAAAERVSHLPSELCDFIREQARELAEAKQQRANTFADLLAEEEKVGELQAAASQSAIQPTNPEREAMEIVLNEIAEIVGIETPYRELPDAVRALASRSTTPLISWLRDNAPDCGDNSCLFGGRGKGGMRTNGGCRCMSDLPTKQRIYVERMQAALSTASATQERSK